MIIESCLYNYLNNNEFSSGDRKIKPVNAHESYHAHVYFDSNSADAAKQFCEDVGREFDLKIGRFHEKLVGPHPRWSCQIVFYRADFESVVPWLENQRRGLTIFIHGVSGDNLKDHTDHAYWLGDAVELDLSVFETD